MLFCGNKWFHIMNNSCVPVSLWPYKLSMLQPLNEPGDHGSKSSPVTSKRSERLEIGHKTLPGQTFREEMLLENLEPGATNSCQSLRQTFETKYTVVREWTEGNIIWSFDNPVIRLHLIYKSTGGRLPWCRFCTCPKYKSAEIYQNIIRPKSSKIFPKWTLGSSAYCWDTFWIFRHRNQFVKTL